MVSWTVGTEHVWPKGCTIAIGLGPRDEVVPVWLAFHQVGNIDATALAVLPVAEGRILVLERDECFAVEVLHVHLELVLGVVDTTSFTTDTVAHTCARSEMLTDETGTTHAIDLVRRDLCASP